MFIFPRKKFQDHFIRDEPPECIGAGKKSGWVTDEEFFIFMQHFIKHVKPTKDEPVLILLENHSSHLSIKTLDLAKDNCIYMLTFPPHLSHKLQPLDVSVFGPFKRYLSSAQDAWTRNNPGNTMTIYNILSIVRTTLPLALTPNNIRKGFERCGIYSFNRDVFGESDYAQSYVTDRPNPADEQGQSFDNVEPVQTNVVSTPGPSTRVEPVQANVVPTPEPSASTIVGIMQLNAVPIRCPSTRVEPVQENVNPRPGPSTEELSDCPPSTLGNDAEFSPEVIR